MEKKIETLTCAPLKIARTSAPYVEIENGQRLMQMYGTMATQKANAEYVVTAVNAYSPMLEALKYASTMFDIAINATPSGAIRNVLCDANIKTKETIALAENKATDTPSSVLEKYGSSVEQHFISYALSDKFKKYKHEMSFIVEQYYKDYPQMKIPNCPC